MIGSQHTILNSDHYRWFFMIFLLLVKRQDEVVNIRLPRFRLQQDIRLTEALRSMGIVDVFEPKTADLSGMSADKLHVNHIVHK